MKKPSVVSFLITLMLAAVVCIQGSEPVKDTNGDPVKLGHEQYFIQPVKTESNNGGGLVPAPTTIFKPCPLSISQALFPYLPGQPVNFKLPHPLKETIVKTSLDINIEFKSDIWICDESSKFWEVDVSSSKILTGGKPEEKKSWFKIEEAEEGAYKLTTSYGTVGTTPGFWFGAPQLVLTNDNTTPLLVKFKKGGRCYYGYYFYFSGREVRSTDVPFLLANW